MGVAMMGNFFSLHKINQMPSLFYSNFQGSTLIFYGTINSPIEFLLDMFWNLNEKAVEIIFTALRLWNH